MRSIVIHWVMMLMLDYTHKAKGDILVQEHGHFELK